MTPICVKCEIEFRCEKNGAPLYERDVRGYTLSRRECDIFKCPECGAEIVVGSGKPTYPDSEEQAVEMLTRLRSDKDAGFRSVNWWANQREKQLAKQAGPT